MKGVEFLKKNGIDIDKALEFFGDLDTFNETLEDFLEEINPKMDRLRKNIETDNMPAYAIDVHSLKSDAKYFGFRELAEMAYEHEMKSKENNSSYVKENFAKLATEVARVLKIIDVYQSIEPAVLPKVSLDPTKATSKESVLVVDDSAIIGKFISKVLEKDYNVTLATSGEECLDLIKAAGPDKFIALFLDINMPGVGGFAVLDYMRENMLFTKMPVAIITGDSTKDNLEKAFTYPIIDVLGKPFTEGAVLTILEKIKSLNN